MRNLEMREIAQISGGNVLTEIKDMVSGGLSPESKTLAVGSLCAGVVVGGIVGRLAPLVGIGGFAAWAVYDATGQHIWQYLGFGGASENSGE